jgi:hypothetical protein
LQENLVAVIEGQHRVAPSTTVAVDQIAKAVNPLLDDLQVLAVRFLLGERAVQLERADSVTGDVAHLHLELLGKLDICRLYFPRELTSLPRLAAAAVNIGTAKANGAARMNSDRMVCLP